MVCQTPFARRGETPHGQILTILFLQQNPQRGPALRFFIAAETCKYFGVRVEKMETITARDRELFAIRQSSPCRAVKRHNAPVNVFAYLPYCPVSGRTGFVITVRNFLELGYVSLLLYSHGDAGDN